MSSVGSFEGLAEDEPYPGVRRRVLDADGGTATRYTFAPNAAFPIHRHAQEQVTLVQSGVVTMSIDAIEHSLAAEGWSVVPGGIPHGIVAGPSGASIIAIVIPRRTAANPIELVAD